MQAGLDASVSRWRGRTASWVFHHGAGVSDTVKNGLDGEAVEGGIEMPYSVPNVHVDYVLTDTGIPVASGAR